MKKIFLLIAITITSFGVFVQIPAGMQPGGMNKGMGNVDHVYGKLTDADGKLVTGASVMLMRKKMDFTTKKMKEVLVKGIITKSNGDFSF